MDNLTPIFLLLIIVVVCSLPFVYEIWFRDDV